MNSRKFYWVPKKALGAISIIFLCFLFWSTPAEILQQEILGDSLRNISVLKAIKKSLKKSWIKIRSIPGEIRRAIPEKTLMKFSKKFWINFWRNSSWRCLKINSSRKSWRKYWMIFWKNQWVTPVSISCEILGIIPEEFTLGILGRIPEEVLWGIPVVLLKSMLWTTPAQILGDILPGKDWKKTSETILEWIPVGVLKSFCMNRWRNCQLSFNI